MEPQQKSNKAAGIIIAIVIVAVIGFFIYSGSNSSQQAPADTATTTAPADVSQIPPADVPKQTASAYKDGMYSATGSYMSPGGPDQIGVTVTLANDIVTDVSVTPLAGDRTSARYQQAFISGYKSLVVGMNIAGINLTRVSGSSLTPRGFDDALAQIRAKAQA